MSPEEIYKMAKELKEGSEINTIKEYKVARLLNFNLEKLEDGHWRHIKKSKYKQDCFYNYKCRIAKSKQTLEHNKLKEELAKKDIALNQCIDSLNKLITAYEKFIYNKA